jgi:hypothetical protein
MLNHPLFKIKIGKIIFAASTLKIKKKKSDDTSNIRERTGRVNKMHLEHIIPGLLYNKRYKQFENIMKKV